MITGEIIPLREDAVQFVYKNWRGVTSMRTATPMGFPYKGSTDWHQEEQWLFDAYDWDKDSERTFALRDADFTDTNEAGKKLLSDPRWSSLISGDDGADQ